MKALGSSCFLC